MKYKILIGLLLVCISINARTFVHPGLSHKLSDLQRMKYMVVAGKEPWATSFANLQANQYASYTYTVKWSLDSTRVVETWGSNYEKFKYDALAAYYNALEWYITNDSRYAVKSVEILNKMKNIRSIVSATESLCAGRVLPKLLEAAEIIKNTYSGWTQTDIDAFKAMLVYPGYSTTISHENDSEHSFYWAMYNGDYGRHGNQGLFGMLGTIQIAVFSDNEIMYDRVVRYMRGEKHRPDDLPYVAGPTNVNGTKNTSSSNSYFDDYSINGVIGTSVDYGYNEVIKNYIWENGQTQEASRDQGHSQLALGLINNICEIAWNQGDDMYSILDYRQLLGWEYYFRYNLSSVTSFADQLSSWEPTATSGEFIQRRDRSQRWFSKKINPWNANDTTTITRGTMFSDNSYTLSTGTKTPMYEMALGHYKSRLNLPFSRLKWLTRADSVSRSKFGYEQQGVQVDYLGFGGLTFHRTDSCAGDPVTFNSKNPVYDVHTVGSTVSTIQAEDFDYMPTGGQGRAYYDLSGTKTLNAYRPDSAVTIESCSAGGYKVKNMVNGEWLNYTINVPTASNYTVKVNYTATASTGKLKFAFGGIDKTSEITLPQTASDTWTNYTIAKNVSLSAGLQAMRIYVTGVSDIISLNSVSIEQTLTSVATGNWNDASTWNLGRVPTADDDVVLADGFAVTLTGSVSCNSLIANGASSIAGTYSSGITLTTTGDVTINGTFSSAFQVLVGGILTVSSGGVWNLQTVNNQLLTTNGSVNIVGTLMGNTTAGGSVCSWIIQGASPTVSVSGILGGTTIGGAGESIRVFLGHTGTATITGTGTINIARLMTNTGNTNDQTTVIDANMNINSTVTTAPALTLQNGSHSTAIKTLTINAGKTVKLGQSGSYFHNYSTAAVANNGGNITYNIYGTLDVSSGKFFLTSNQQTSSQQVFVNVKNGGVLKTGNYLNLLQYSANQKVGIVVEDGGLVDNSTSALSIANCSNVGNSGAKSWITLLTSNALYKQYVADLTLTPLWIGKSTSSYDVVSARPNTSGVPTVLTVNVHGTVSGSPNTSSLVNSREWNITSSVATNVSIMMTSGDVTNTKKAVYGTYSGGVWSEATASYDSGSGTFTPATAINFTATTTQTFATGTKSGFVNTLSPQSGDYVSIANGDFGTAANWAVSNGSGGYTTNPATVAPDATKNCWVTNGYTLTQASNDATCCSLTIQNGGTVTSNGKKLTLGANATPGDLDIQSGGKYISLTAPAGSVATLAVFGPNITVDGQLGAAISTNTTAYNATTNPNGGAGVRLFCEYYNTTTNSPTNIAGNGVINIARLQPGSTNAGQIQSIVVDRDINILNTNANTSALSLNNGNSNTATKTLTINANRTVAFTGGAISGSGLHYGGTTPGTYTNTAGGYIYNINGTLDMGGNSIQLVGPTTAGSTQTIALNVGATGKVITGTLVRLYKNMTGQSIAINLSTGSTWQIGGSVVPTYDNAGNSLVADWPTTYSNVYVDNSASSGTLTMPASGTINGTLTLKTGVLTNSTNIITMASGSTVDMKGGSLTTTPTVSGTDKYNVSYTGSSAQNSSVECTPTNGLNNLTVNNSAGVNLASGTTVNGTLTLTSGTLTNGTNLTLGNGATVAISGGTLSATPTFGSSVNLSYSASSIKGLEFPVANIVSALTVGNTAGISLSDNRSLSTLTINSGKALTIAAGKQLSVNTALTNNGTINLLSDATGTATILTPASISGTGTASVQQYLASGRNWYISSPVTGATSSAITTATGNSMVSYNEVDGTWPAADATLSVGKGYIAVSPISSGVVTFTGILNTGTQSFSLNRSDSAIVKRGFNLVGNPYPSYLNWESATRTNVGSTMWYRSKDAGSYVFATYGAVSQLGTSLGGTPVTKYIPPMQAFWVRVSGVGSGTLAFDNSMRSHSATSNLLKAPAATQQVLRLLVSNGTNSDEAIVFFNENASNGFDNYDSPKMSNANAAIPEIYTMAGGEKLVINGLTSVTPNEELALGFTTGQSNTFSIKATEFSNFGADTKVYLRDNVLNTEQELTIGSDYSFTSDISNSASRFSLLFRVADVTTKVEDRHEAPTTSVYQNSNNRITIVNKGKFEDQIFVSVYNALGEKLLAKKLTSTTTELSQFDVPGVYMVIVTTNGKSRTEKVIIN